MLILISFASFVAFPNMVTLFDLIRIVLSLLVNRFGSHNNRLNILYFLCVASTSLELIDSFNQSTESSARSIDDHEKIAIRVLASFIAT